MGRDGYIALGVLALCGALWRQLATVAENPLVPIGPTFYPRLLLAVTGILGLCLLAADLLSRRRAAPPGPGARPPAAWRPALLTFGAAILYAFLLPPLGYLPATTLFVTGLAWALGRIEARRLPGALLLGVLTALTTWVIFERYLHVFLPRSAWFQ